MRGEQSFPSMVPAVWVGSSPRARGAARSPERRGAERGVIPACAGSSGQSGSRSAQRWGHPRVRGEQEWKRDVALWREGSSPRARGAVFLTCNAIPADPPFLQVVEKQTKPTLPQPSTPAPLPHQPSHPHLFGGSGRRRSSEVAQGTGEELVDVEGHMPVEDAGKVEHLSRLGRPPSKKKGIFRACGQPATGATATALPPIHPHPQASPKPGQHARPSVIGDR